MMSSVVSFFIGFLGGTFMGVILMAAVQAGRKDEIL